MYIVDKYKLELYELQEQEEKEPFLRLPLCFEASTNKVYISRQCAHIVFILQCPEF